MSSPLNVPNAIAFSSPFKEVPPRKPGRVKSIDLDVDTPEALRSGARRVSQSSLRSSYQGMNRRGSNESALTASVGDFDRYSQLSIELVPDGGNSESDICHSSFAPDCSFHMLALDKSPSSFASPRGYVKTDGKPEYKYNEYDRQSLSAFRSELPLQEEPTGASFSTFCPDYSTTDIVFGIEEERKTIGCLVDRRAPTKVSRDQRSCLK